MFLLSGLYFLEGLHFYKGRGLRYGLHEDGGSELAAMEER